MLIYKDSEGNKQEQYFYATANNQKSWVENFDDYSNHDYHNAAQSDADFAEKAGPYAKGAALLLFPIGLVNDVVSLKTGKDIYGNNVDEMGKMISFLDIATFGLSKMNWMRILKSNSTVEGLERTNTFTTIISSFSTIKNELKQNK